ncbi:hypothetical protein EJB05_28724, partial [Eragrostis curvula]
MEDHHQQCIQLAHPSRSSSTHQPRDDDARWMDMCPSLYHAVHRGRTEEVMALLLQQHGAAGHDQRKGIVQHERCDILEASAEGNTVLHVAAEHGHDDLIRELHLRFREKTGLLSCRNSALDTPLHRAARAGHAKAVAVLIQLTEERGESILDCKNEAGDTALHLAARHGHGAAVEVLVSAAAATASELNNAGVSPLYLAVVSGSVQAVRAIVTSCRDASPAGPGSQNALHAAVFQSSEMVELLLQWRPSLADEVDGNGSTPLHFAASDGHRSVVRAILHAAPPRAAYRKDRSGGLSALHVAARMGHDRVVRELIRSCPDAGEIRDDGGGTFLHAAAKEKRASVVSLAAGDPMLRGLLDARDRDGNTPLHLAVAAGAPASWRPCCGRARCAPMCSTTMASRRLTSPRNQPVSLVLILVAFGARSRPQRQDHLKPWSGRDIGKGIETASDSLSVVAGLIATAAFAAGFQLPGGYGDDGTANLKDKPAFKCFMYLNTFAVAMSVVTVILLVYGKASRSAGTWKSFVASLHCMWLSLNSPMMAFYAALTAVTNKGDRVGLLYLNVDCACNQESSLTDWRSLWRSRFRTRQDAIIKRQYPFAGATLPSILLLLVINFLVTFGFDVVSNPSVYSAYLPGRHSIFEQEKKVVL